MYRQHPTLVNYGVDQEGNIRNVKTQHIIKTYPLKNGYYTVCCSQNGKVKNKLLSRFVYECHNGLIRGGLVIDHIDGNISNNNILNLQAVTQSENLKKRGPLMRIKKRVEATKISDNSKQIFETVSKASKTLGIFSQRIKDVCNGITKSSTSKITHDKYTFKYLN